MEFASEKADQRLRQTADKLVRYIWPAGVILTSAYAIIFYLLPILGVFNAPSYPFKLAVELMLCSIPVLAVLMGTAVRVALEDVLVGTYDDLVIASMGNHHVGTCCLQMDSTLMSSVRDEEGEIVYDTSMLLAIRAGLEGGVRVTFEAGIENSQPVIRLFVTTTANSVNALKRILQREATRCEAIIMSSLYKIELRQLKGIELEQAVTRSKLSGDVSWSSNLGKVVLLLKGRPRCSPKSNATQIGRFMSTLLKQKANALLVCTLSAARPGKERKRLESRWRKIRAKEKRKDDSLAEQAEKQELLGHYRTIQSDGGWYDSTVYIQVQHEADDESRSIMNSLDGIVASLWGNDESFEMESHEIDRPTLYRMVTRGHIKKQRIHTNDLVAYVNLPVQRLPVISKSYTPVFEIPSREKIDHELKLGWSIYEGRDLSPVGLRKNWLVEHMAVLGATGTGKTTLVKHLIVQLSQKTEIPWWVFDVKGSEYCDLTNYGNIPVLMLRPGLDPNFVIELVDSETDSKETAHTTFVILRELLRERGISSDLSPAMEKLLRDAVIETVSVKSELDSVSILIEKIEELAGNDRSGQMTRDALLNRLEILTREPLKSVFGNRGKKIRISDLLKSRVIFDLRYVARVGGMDAARLLYNLVAKRIFESAMKRGLSSDLEHVVVLEEASNLVPESYTRNTAADVTTGESMVLLQRATGQGVVVVSTRPTISSNILANTATKVVFRLPYDSEVGARFLSLDEEQEKYLRSLEVGRALISIPKCRTFEIATLQPSATFDNEEEVFDSKLSSVDKRIDESEDFSSKEETLEASIPEVTSHIMAFLASERTVVLEDLIKLIGKVKPEFTEDQAESLVQTLISRSIIERESISLMPGGSIFALPGKGLESIGRVIKDYIISRLDSSSSLCIEDVGLAGCRILLDETAVLIFTQHLKSSSIDSILQIIRQQMTSLGNNVETMHVVVRGSLAAARLREFISDIHGFENVNVVSAFPSSLEGLLQTLQHPTGSPVESGKNLDVLEKSEAVFEKDAAEQCDDLHRETTDRVQKRIWLGLLQDFVEIKSGLVSWDDIINFIETTSLQSSQSRSVPLRKEVGKQALTELLADEMLTAIRNETNDRWIEIDEGLWIVNTRVLERFRKEAMGFLRDHLARSNLVHVGHEFYDLCSGDTSYVLFPTQQQLTTLQRMHGEIACRKCKSTKVVCILSAAEYMDESIVNPKNLELVTLDRSLKTIRN